MDNEELDEKPPKTIKRIYEKIVLKYLIVVQSHWMLTIGVLFYMLYIIREDTINNILKRICYESIVSTGRSQFCLSSLIKSNIFTWKNEIIFRAGYSIYTHNQTLPSLSTKSSYTSVAVYLLLISVALINFFITLVVILVLFNSRKKNENSYCNSEAESNCLLTSSDDYIRVDVTISNHVNILEKNWNFY